MKLDRLRLDRAQDAWWAAYSDAREEGADMHVWLADHPYPAETERVAEQVRRILDPAA